MSGPSEPMAVVAPSFSSDPASLAAHAPQVLSNGVNGRQEDSSSDEEMPLSQHTPKKINGANGKRIANPSSSNSSEDDRPLTKKPRVSTGLARKRIVESDSEQESSAGPSSPPAPPVKSATKPPSRSNGAIKPKSKARSPSDSELSSEDERPLAKKGSKAPKRSASPVKKPAAKPRKSYKESSGSEDEKPLAKTVATKGRKSNGSASARVKKEEESEDDAPLAKGKKRASAGADSSTARKDVKKKVKEESGKVKKEVKEEDDEEMYKWWEQGENDGSVKWTTLVHNGVLFPPPYVPLPKDVKMKYDGQSITLPPESEEVAGFFGAMLETDHVLDPVFKKNFFNDFKDMLKEFPPKENIRITSLEKCDFRPMYEHFEREREKKKAMTREEKKAIKEAKDKLEEPYLYALVDGRKEKLGNFRAEPPALFRGRGEHPKKGTLKKRLRPEDIILNIGKDVPIPKPNIPGNWKGVQHDNTVTWLAHWKENVNNQAKYVFLAASSSWKGQSDRSKFEKARELIKHVDKIRKDYTEDLKSKVMADRQRATALYFIDRLALRAGNEKGDDEAETYGCCSLLFEHVTLSPPNTIIFDFLGKDSMRFHQEVDVDIQVFKNIKIFKAEPKKKGDDIFDRLTTSGLNAYLNTQMKGLTAKVFRTYNASWTFQQQLKTTPKNGTVQEKIAAYNTANREVAILCNHQKTVSKNFEQSFAKMGDKVRALKYQRMKLRYQLFTLEPKMKKKRADLAESESDMDDEFMERHEEELREKAVEAAKKKFEKENTKLVAEKEKAQPKSVLDERLKEIKAEFKELAKERKTKKVEPKKGATVEKLEEQIQKMEARIAAARVQMEDRDKTKDVALGTSKINYIDPRLTVAWARKYDVPLEKLFSKTLREKFPWAEAEADADWVF